MSILADCVRATGAEDTNLQLLDCTDKNISSLDGIEQFNDLRVLIVPQNHSKRAAFGRFAAACARGCQPQRAK